MVLPINWQEEIVTMTMQPTIPGRNEVLSSQAPAPMRTVRVHRTDDADLEFDGWLLADASSRADLEQDHWTEIRIYRTNHQLYVTEVVHRSDWDGVDDRRAVRVHAEADTIRDALLRKSPNPDGAPFLPHHAVDALVAAGQADPAICPFAAQQ